MQKIASRMPLLMVVAVWFVFKASQVSAEVFPIDTVESLWGSSTQLVQDDTPNNYLYDAPTNPECKKSTRENNENDIKWFKTCIVDVYGFKKDNNVDKWVVQGDFGGKINTPEFEVAAKRALAFFKANKDWSITKSTYKTNQGCLELLYITAARYLFVTYVLWKQNGDRLKPCEVEANTGKIIIPRNPPVCYPKPYGSASCTSDYDVGLVGKDSGTLTEGFNEFFKSPKNGFGTPSESVFDTNVYAFTLEYAIPNKFTGLPPKFVRLVKKSEKTVKFQMQELVNAYYKVFKYNEEFFKVLMRSGRKRLSSKRYIVAFLNRWNRKVKGYNRKVPLRGTHVRQRHNDEYQALVKSISKSGGYARPRKNLETLGQALLYAAEAYHTRGAIRHVVGSMQMKISDYQPSKLSTMDLWVSMIENWGESNKEYHHSCTGSVKVEICVLKMSKYLWRVVEAKKHLRERVEAFKNQISKREDFEDPMPRSLVKFENPSNPDEIMRNWYKNYRQTGKTEIDSCQLELSSFFGRFKCTGVMPGKPFPFKCLEAMNARISEYNEWLAKMFVHNHSRKHRQGREKWSRPYFAVY